MVWPWFRFTLASAVFIFLLFVGAKINDFQKEAQAAGTAAADRMQELGQMTDTRKQALGRDNVTEAELYELMLIQFNTATLQTNDERELWVYGGLAASVAFGGEALNELYRWRRRERTQNAKRREVPAVGDDDGVDSDAKPAHFNATDHLDETIGEHTVPASGSAGPVQLSSPSGARGEDKHAAL